MDVMDTKDGLGPFDGFSWARAKDCSRRKFACLFGHDRYLLSWERRGFEALVLRGLSSHKGIRFRDEWVDHMNTNGT